MEAMDQRTEFVLAALKSTNFRALCQDYGISPKTGYKWKERFLRDGLGGLAEHSRRPKSSPEGLGEQVVCEIVRLKQKHKYWGARKLRDIYGRVHAEVPSESSFKRVLERAGMVEHRQLRSRQTAGRLFSERKAKVPNEVWTVDFKGWWYGANGRRCEPLTVRDEFSRYVLEVRAVANAQTQTVRECFEALFRRHGLPAAIRSDNGAPFASRNGILGLSRLSAWWLVLGIDLERSRPACPQDNGGHERLHLDVARELSGERPAEQQAAFDEWRQTFNQERPHEALGMKRPAEVYQPAPRKYEGTPEDLTYAKMGARRVHACGYINFQDQRVFLSAALAGWSVGVEPLAGKQFNLWFGRLLLGQLDERTFGFTRAGNPEKVKARTSPQAASLRSAAWGEVPKAKPESLIEVPGAEGTAPGTLEKQRKPNK
jgi:putative transposase